MRRNDPLPRQARDKHTTNIDLKIGFSCAGAHGWIDWNMALRVQNCTAAGQPHCLSDGGQSIGPCCTTGPNHVDDVGDDAPVIVDPVLGSVRFQPIFHFIGHFSRFLPPGSTRIGAELRESATDRCVFFCMAFSQ